MNSRPPSLRQLQAWLQLRELRLRALHAKLESRRQERDQAVLACQHQQVELGRLRAQRQAVQAWCTGPDAGIGPAGLALALAHDKLLVDRLERADDAALGLDRQRLRAEQALLQARAQCLQALRQQQAARRWLADWQRRYGAQDADSREAEAAEARLHAWPDGADDIGGRRW